MGESDKHHPRYRSGNQTFNFVLSSSSYICSILGPVLIVLALGLIALVTYTYFDAMMPALGMAPFSISWCLCTSVGVWILINLVFNYAASIMIPASFVELPGKKAGSGISSHCGNAWGLFGGVSPRPSAGVAAAIAKLSTGGRGIASSAANHSPRAAALDELEAGRGGDGVATRGLISGSGASPLEGVASSLQEREHTEIGISSSSNNDSLHSATPGAGAGAPRARVPKENDADDTSITAAAAAAADENNKKHDGDDEDEDGDSTDSDSHDYYDEVTKGDPNKTTFCSKCNVTRPPRAHHCQLCERCVHKMGM